MFATTITARTR